MALLARFCTVFILVSALSAFAQTGNESPPSTPKPIAYSHWLDESVSWLQNDQLRIVRLTFVGEPALTAAEQQEIERSLKQLTYANDDKGADELKDRVRDAWQQHGYFNAQVGNPNVDQRSASNSEDSIAVTISVVAGKQYRLEGINITGNSQFTAGELRSMFPISDGEILNTRKIREGMEAIRAAYGTKGFINITANPTSEFHEESSTILIDIELEEGKQFRVGLVELAGIDRIRGYQHLQNAGLEPGSIFSFANEERFKNDRSLLPPICVLKDIEHHINEREGTVDLTMDFSGCRFNDIE